MKQFLWRWGPALALMALIFALSSLPKADVPGVGDYWSDWIVKKGAHVLGYGLLGLAYLRGLTGGEKPTWRQAAWAVLFAVLYGITDEWHQSLAPGREPRPRDVLIDGMGAAAGVWLRTFRAQVRAATRT